MGNNPLHKDVCETQETAIVRFNYDAALFAVNMEGGDASDKEP